MSEPVMTMTFDCKKGEGSPAFAMQCCDAALQQVNAIAADVAATHGIAPMEWSAKQMQWVDDGNDEVVIQFFAEGVEG